MTVPDPKASFPAMGAHTPAPGEDAAADPGAALESAGVTSHAVPPAGTSPTAEARWREVDVGGGGERVDHRYPNDLYFAHLSLYRFALPFARDRRVIDLGSGAGYGAEWLAAHGARSVLGIDIDAQAVAFSRDHFDRPGLRFETMDVTAIKGLPAGGCDLLFSSNTLEHVADPWAVLRAAASLLSDEGVLVIAVPAVVNIVSRVQQLSNPHHLVIWSPEQWFHAIGLYFAEVEGWRHLFAHPTLPLDVHNSPEECRINEVDFAFERMPDDDLRRDTLTTVFVARRPRGDAELPPIGAAPSYVDDSFVRQRPRWTRTPLPLEEAALPARPIAALPGRALALLRRGGPRALVAEARRYVVWRLRRREALRLLGDRVGEAIETPRPGRGPETESTAGQAAGASGPSDGKRGAHESDSAVDEDGRGSP